MARDQILTVNAGSSSLKLALFEAGRPPRRVSSVSVERLGSGGRNDAVEGGASYARAFEDGLEHLLPRRGLAGVVAVGHRIVHGGPRFEQSMVVTSELLGELRRMTPL